GGAHGRAYASGMAAINSVCNLLSAGDHLLCGEDVYGGTRRLFTQVYERYDVEVDYVNMTDPDAVAEACRPETEVLWVESPTNP
ncbi:MAG: cystathionine gamma-synthase, partial [Actinobacteria bacterium]|nr:cystathionine gamma-synthase [Actinomycetota bacterium]NIU71462.1 cystathionine gamma-synthase [Actinomycetota bacterium]NIW33429.1 cystathionine gamma-synthase [Actinomycetota bacterium]NIX25514.1 cystathionine gamma-synthase [Actinomycetota bacterium]